MDKMFCPHCANATCIQHMFSFGLPKIGKTLANHDYWAAYEKQKLEEIAKRQKESRKKELLQWRAWQKANK